MKKKAVLWVLGLVMLATLLGGKWMTDRYMFFRWQLLRRDAAVLDLKDRELTVADFEELREKLPDTRILWNVPFRGGFFPSDTEQISVSALADEDLPMLEYLPRLKYLDADSCGDYENLLAFAEAHPGVKINWQVSLGGTVFDNTVRDLRLADPSAEELLEKLRWLHSLERLTLTGTLPEPEALTELQQAYPDMEILWEIPLEGETVLSNVQTLDLRGKDLSEENLRQLLGLLPQLQTVDLTGSTLSDEVLMVLAGEFPQCFFLWEMTFGDKKIPTDVREMDISGQIQESTEFVESRLPYFPNLEKVIMSHCGLDDETMDALNRRYENIRFIWTVKIKNLDVRTDETWFYPVKLDRSAVVESKDLYALRYCTDMVCIDVGHMWGVKDCEWAAFMPNLRYLVLAYTSVADLSPLSGLKNLVFLEIFHTPVKDYSPLIGCTGLEDLNLSMTTGDYRPFLEMPWLKNVWWNGVAGSWGQPCSGAHEVLPAEMPQINWHFHGRHAAYKSGWRKLPNYYAMRDWLDMFYLI